MSPNPEAVEILVFDTGPLTHIAREGWLGVLKAVVGQRRALVPDTVVDELQRGAAADSRLQTVLEASWLERRELTSPSELEAFAMFSALLVRRGRNRGEAGVLALAATIGGVAVIDDGAGRRAAAAHHIALRPTLSLLCEAIRENLLTVPLVSALADDLMTNYYRLPFGVGGFEKWASDQGLLE